MEMLQSVRKKFWIMHSTLNNCMSSLQGDISENAYTKAALALAYGVQTRVYNLSSLLVHKIYAPWVQNLQVYLFCAMYIILSNSVCCYLHGIVIKLFG